jgi:hypothetical protein
MLELFEKYGDEVGAKDGGFVFQAIISHEVKWEIYNGETRIDPKGINCVLHRLDLFPDLNFTEGFATSTYVILSEVNLLKRKFDLASEAIKKRLSPEYAQELEALGKAGTTEVKKQEINLKYFKGTYFEAVLKTNKIVLREVSSSGLDSGAPSVTLKISTGMVDTLDGAPTGSWENISLSVSGTKRLRIDNTTEEKLSEIREFDEVENVNDLVFRTIIPSLILQFKGDSVAIDTYSNRSAEVAVGASVDYENLFNVEDTTKAEAEDSPEEINK